MKKINKIIAFILIVLSITLITFTLTSCDKEEKFEHRAQVIKSNNGVNEIIASVSKVNKFETIYTINNNNEPAKAIEFEIKIENYKQSNDNVYKIKFIDFDFFCLDKITIYTTSLCDKDGKELNSFEINSQKTLTIKYRVIYKYERDKEINNYILKLCDVRI